jgi:hypothetical protein
MQKDLGLKRKVIALSVIERARKKQYVHITNIKERGANTKNFHLRVNAWRRKNHIYRLKHNQGWVTEHAAKKGVVNNHFKSVLGTRVARVHDFNWDELNFPLTDLNALGDLLSEAEVKSAIDQMPTDKAPGPDDYTGAFFNKCWDIIKGDLMRVILQFGNLHAENFHCLNSANIALLPKKDAAEEVGDFRPISLIHAIAKIISKI